MEAILFAVLPTVFVLGVLIAIHEFGHFICAKLSGVFVEKFSIGFGPEILSFKKGDTVYALSLIPLGGFVKMGGETVDEREGQPLKPTDFLAQSMAKRFAIVFAGPFMNYSLAYVILLIVFLGGTPQVTTRIGDILADSPAAQNGLVSGDRITRVNGVEVSKWLDMTEFIAKSEGNPISFDIDRDGTPLNLTFAAQPVERTDIFGDAQTTYQIGIASGGEVIYEKHGVGGAIVGAGGAVWELTHLTVKSLFRLATGRLSLKAMSGPLGIVDMASKTARQGILPLLQMMAYLSVFLAVFNLLPFPALDGGHLLFLFLELILRRPVKYHVQERFAQVGFVLLMTLMVVVLYNDMDRFGWIDKVKNLLFQ